MRRHCGQTKSTAKSQTAAAGAARPKPSQAAQGQPAAPAQSDVKSANAGAAKPPQSAPAPQQQAAAPQADTVNSTSLLRGAQATVPAGSFDSRWGAMR